MFYQINQERFSAITFCS